jgi:microtubule-associated protein-like 6
MLLPSTRLVSAHFLGELWAICAHPSLPLFFSAGDDATLRCWHLQMHLLVSYLKLPNKCRAIDILPTNGNEIAVALSNGQILIVKITLMVNPHGRKLSQLELYDPEIEGSEVKDLNDMKGSVIELPVCTKQTVQEVKFCFDGKFLAVGSHDTNIYLYNRDDVSGEYVLLKTILKAHASYITHIDFGVILNVTSTQNQRYDASENLILTIDRSTDEVLSSRPLLPEDICIQSTCGAYELLFWKVTGQRITSATALKDADWQTWTCTLGWPVQGIWHGNMDGKKQRYL